MATPINKQLLRELASDPEQTAESIRKALGISNLYYEFQKDPSLRTVFDEGRVAARAAAAKRPPDEGQATTPTPTARKTKEKVSGRKRATSSTPPRNGNARGGVGADLLRKIILEFNHIDVYGDTSEHFNELRQEIGAVL